MRSIEKNFEAQASAPVEARMVAVAAGAGPRGGPSGALPHFAFEIVLDEQSALTCFSAQFHKAHPQGPASFSLRLEQARPRPTSADLARPRPTSLLQDGGRLVYSTCSMNPVEDEVVVAQTRPMTSAAGSATASSRCTWPPSTFQ